MKFKLKKISRRKFLLLGALLSPLAAAADAKWIEPTWLRVRQLRIGDSQPTVRLAHFTDLHHKGDREYGEAVVSAINAAKPDLVCFTGDLIEEKQHLDEALQILSGIKAPLYGVPGNHDYWSRVSFEPIRQCFAATGGAFLLDEQRVPAGGRVNLIGLAGLRMQNPRPTPVPGMKNIVLMHYPAWAKQFAEQKFDLLLAGHSHGGQVRVPLYGAVHVPWGVDEYDMGLFQTPAGPLYVNPGIGWFPLPVRFNCRPEVTVIEV